MKRIVFFVVFTFVVNFISCVKKEEPDLSKYQANGYLSGLAWSASRVDLNLEANNILSFGFSKYNVSGELRHQMSLQNLMLSKDTIFLKYWKRNLNALKDSIIPTANFVTLTADGDVLSESYELIDDKSFRSWVLLKKISETEISGKFEVAFVNNYRRIPTNNPLPDSIFFTKGEFLGRFN